MANVSGSKHVTRCASDHIISLVATIPLCAHLHLAPDDEGGLALPDDERLRNHLGSVHAGALYTLGEAASGLAVLGAFPDLAEASLLVARHATVDYKKPARGRVTGQGSLRESADTIRQRLRTDGKVTFAVDVALRASAVEVATMTVTWYAPTLRWKIHSGMVW